jgi:hypothetical protein
MALTESFSVTLPTASTPTVPASPVDCGAPGYGLDQLSAGLPKCRDRQECA